MRTPLPWSPEAPSWARPLFLALPVVAVPVAIVLDVAWPRLYSFLLAEDRLVEWLTFLAYAVTAVLALRLAARLRGRGWRLPALLYLLLGLGLVWVAGEEITWGQRLLGFDGPTGLVERNRQSEANLHNLVSGDVLHPVYIAVGLYGAGLARVLVPRVPGMRDHVDLYAPPRVLAPWFAVASVYYAYYEYVNWLPVRLLGPAVDIKQTGRLQELPELLLSVALLSFVVMVRERLAREPVATGPGAPTPVG